MATTTCVRIVEILVVLFASTQLDVHALKDVVLTLDPPEVGHKQNCTLTCSYDAENLALYSINWYHQQHEFYRYDLNMKPQTQSFELPEIHIDKEHSNGTHVVLQDIDFNAAGSYTCRVAAGPPTFATIDDTKILKVVYLESPTKTELILEPAVVELDQNLSCTLTCAHNVLGESPYIVKWYHGNKEFYRYSFNKNSPKKAFDGSGLIVDLERSNATQVVLQDVDFKAGGSYSCAVTKEGEIATLYDTKILTVVGTLKESPILNVTVESSSSDDRIIATCKSPRSHPPAKLRFILNNSEVPDFHSTKETFEEYSQSELFLYDAVSSAIPDSFLLHCEAYVDDVVFQNRADVRLKIY